MSIQALKDLIPDYGRDIRLNLENVLTTDDGAPGLTPEQIGGVALACAYSSGNRGVIDGIEGEFAAKVGPAVVEAAKSAATIMGMNNVYYRFTHMVEDKEIAKLPARLRMNVIGSPGIAKVDFELMSLAVSAIEGCGACVNAHVHEARKAGIANEGIQSSIRIAAIITAAKQAIAMK